jgi:hypothetical protein
MDGNGFHYRRSGNREVAPKIDQSLAARSVLIDDPADA